MILMWQDDNSSSIVSCLYYLKYIPSYVCLFLFSNFFPSLSFSLPISLCPCLSLFLHLSITMCLFLFISIYLIMSVHFSLSLPLLLPLFLFVSPSASLYPSLSKHLPDLSPYSSIPMSIFPYPSPLSFPRRTPREMSIIISSTTNGRSVARLPPRFCEAAPQASPRSCSPRVIRGAR